MVSPREDPDGSDGCKDPNGELQNVCGTLDVESKSGHAKADDQNVDAYKVQRNLQVRLRGVGENRKKGPTVRTCRVGPSRRLTDVGQEVYSNAYHTLFALPLSYGDS